MVGEVGPEPARKRERVADLDTLAREAQVELAALLPEHPQVERGVVGDEQGILADEVEEPPHRLLRRNAVHAKERLRQTVHRLRPRVHRARRPDIECQRP